MIANQAPFESTSIGSKLPTLISQIQSSWPLQKWLAAIYIADDLTVAIPYQIDLAPHESIVTRQGIWMGKNWIRVNKAVDKSSSVLIREQELKVLQNELNKQQDDLQSQEVVLHEEQKRLQLLETERDLQHRTYQSVSASFTEIQAKLTAQQSRFNELQKQQQRLTYEFDDSQRQIQDLEAKIEQARHQLAESIEVEQDSINKRAEFMQQRECYQQELNDLRRSAQQHRQKADEFTMRLTTIENQLNLLKQNEIRDKRQREQLKERYDLLTTQLAEDNEPLNEIQHELQMALTSRLTVEQNLHLIEEQLRQSNQQFKELLKMQQQIKDKLEKSQNQNVNLQIERQAVLTRQTTIQEQLQELNLCLEKLITSLPDKAEITAWEQRLEQVTAKIGRLGAINLAAIDEFQAVQERKSYYDKQHADLCEALQILKEAIAKIDRESRAKFQETYQRINQHFQQLFPQIFNGGKASLELCEDDLLTTGIILKAQPPGKRNATIHMLSGGEKALTAIALVFAMFHLNPAPFCILDEVDAPLDDSNVNRFCQLVKEMAKKTQFIIVSHNKGTISMANCLLGVTMQEAGVSRIVSVNVTEAVAMAEA